MRRVKTIKMADRKNNATRNQNRQAYVQDEEEEEQQQSFPPDTPSPSHPKSIHQSIATTPSNRFLQRNPADHHHNQDLLGVSTSSTYSASSSRTANGISTLQPFFNISSSELHFFDTLISLLPKGSSDFSVLKRTYEETLSSQLGEAKVQVERDAKLWNLLLSLLPIRGKTWASKWDSVRMGIGMEPRSSDEEKDETSVSSSNEDDAATEDEGEQHKINMATRPSGSTATTSLMNGNDRRNHAHQQASDSIKSKIEALTAKAGSLALQAAHSSSSRPKNSQEKTPSVFLNQHQQQLSRGKGLVRDSKSNSNSATPSPTPPYHQVANPNHHQTSSLPQAARFPTNPSSMTAQKNSNSATQETQQRRKVRIVAPGSEAAYELEQEEKRKIPVPRSESQPSFPSSSTPQSRPIANQGQPITRTTRSGRKSEPSSFPNQSESSPQIRASSSERKPNSTPTQRRFDEVVKQARAERESLRLAEQARVEAEEERLWSFASQKADSYYNENLCFKSLAWWNALYRKQSLKLEQVEMGRDRVLMGRSFEKWIEMKRNRGKSLERAGKVDEVRCTLGAWRIWIKRRNQRLQDRKEKRKLELKSAYSQVVRNGNQRLISNAWEVSYQQLSGFSYCLESEDY